MARPGITYSEVARAATQLTAQKTRPSIEGIRKVLGTGSNSTINRHLREWREKQGNACEIEQGLPESLLIAVRGLYEALQDEASGHYRQLEAEKQKVVDDIKTRCEMLEKNYANLLQENKALEKILYQRDEEAENLHDEIEQLNQQNEKKVTENQLLSERLVDKENEIERLAEQVKHAQSNLEHFRESLREERMAEKQAYETRLAEGEHKLSFEQNKSAAISEDNVKLKQRLEGLEQTHTAMITARDEALEKIKTHEIEAQCHVLQHQQLTDNYQSLQSKYDERIKKSDANSIKLNELSVTLEKYRERVKLLNSSLQKAEDRLEAARDKNSFLTQEKTELATQLKQLKAVEI